jgi:hypothetical protein
MAASSTKTPPEPAPDETSPADAAPAPDPAPAKQVIAEYLDETPRTYLWPDGPQTAERGDVCVLPDGWANDGRWRPFKGVISRLRDNHPDQATKTSERQAEARRKAHEQAAGAAGQE